MRGMKVSVFLVACFGASLTLGAQGLGGLPSLDWYRFAGDSIRLVTTPATLPFAERSYDLIEGLTRLRPLPLGDKLKRIDMFVQPVTVEANGFVGVTPWRSFLYATPPQDQSLISTNSWVDALAIHEYRHVEQYSNLLRGWTKFARVVAGNAGWGVLTGLSTPDWFFEGDAVYSETVLTYAGRGRTPAFTALQRAMALEDVRYPYIKARNGSLRSRLPDHYRLGYAMVQHGRLVYDDPWRTVVRKAGRFWPPLYPFSGALKRETGLSTRRFYRETYDSLGQVWKEAASAKTFTPHRSITPLGRQVPIYAYPQPAYDPSDSLVVVMRRRRDDINRLVLLRHDGREQDLTPLGFSVDDAFHAAGEALTWARFSLDARRPDESYSDVYVADLDDAKPRRITTQQQLFSPGLSATGEHVVAVKLPPGGPDAHTAGRRPCLVELDAANGRVVREACFGYELIIGPRFADADRGAVIAVVKLDGFLSLQRLDFDGGVTQLTPWTRHVLGTPYVHEDHAYFSADFSGVDNVYRVSTAGGGELEQLTEVAVGAYHPSTDGSTLYFTEVAAAGDPVSVLPAEQWLRRPVAIVEPAELAQYAALVPDAAGERFRRRYLPSAPARGAQAALTQGAVTQTAVTQGTPSAAIVAEGVSASRSAKPYSSLLDGFGITQLSPVVDNVEASYGLLGETRLGDYSASLTAGYNLNEERGFVRAEVTVARTWPWVVLSFGQTNRNVETLTEVGEFGITDADETSVGLDLEAPLQQLIGAYAYQLTPTLGVAWRDVDYEQVFNRTGGVQLFAGDYGIWTGEAALSFRRLRQTATKHILPREGQLLDVSYSDQLALNEGSGSALPPSSTPSAKRFTATVGQFLPGFAATHGLLLRARYRQETLSNVYVFSDRFFYARGYTSLRGDRNTTLSVDYHFPLLYPDVGFGGIAYLQRIRANVWGDLSSQKLERRGRVFEDEYRSVGVDVTGDFVFFNAQPLPVGVRFPYLLDGAAVGFASPQLLVSLDF